MTIGRTNTEALAAPLSLAHGGFAMLALDQRESLRDMFVRAGHGPMVGDDTLRRFKLEAAEILTPHASGVLLDRPLAVTEERPAGLAPGCGAVPFARSDARLSGLEPPPTPERLSCAT